MVKRTVILGLVAALGLMPGAQPRDSVSGTQPARAAAPGRLVRLADGRRINFRCSGAGSPTVLLEGGFAATSLAWWKVQPHVATTNRVCAYDRAGYGFSDPGPMPRDGPAVARDLDAALRTARIAGPFVLVGHSAGGLYVRLFADRRPRDVVGMVLVDPSVEHQEQRFTAAAGRAVGGTAGIAARVERCLKAAQEGALPSADPALAGCTPSRRLGQSDEVYRVRLAEALRAPTWATQLSEISTLWTSTSNAVEAGRRSYGAMPLIVLTAGRSYPGAAGMFWSALHAEIAVRSTRGSSRVVADSSHMMMVDRPDAIVAAIAEIVAAGRSPRR